MNYKRFEILG